MLSIQHILCGTHQGHTDSEYLAASILPDAIRAYTGRREYTHFEENAYQQDEPEKGDISYWTFPSDMKTITRESVQAQLEQTGHLATGIHPAAIGEMTHIETFVEYNRTLPPTLFLGCKDHLIQDARFDAFIRTELDCRGKEQDVFLFQQQEYNGAQVRQLIGQIEQHGIYILAHDIYEKTGLLCNQDWLETTIKPVLEDAYPMALAEQTFSYMKIDETVNQWITEKDWSHLDAGPIPHEHYESLYQKVFADMEQNQQQQAYDQGIEAPRPVSDLLLTEEDLAELSDAMELSL